jgi:hypothetical protein
LAGSDFGLEAVDFDLLLVLDFGFGSGLASAGFSAGFSSDLPPPKIFEKKPFFSSSPRAGWI